LFAGLLTHDRSLRCRSDIVAHESVKIKRSASMPFLVNENAHVQACSSKQEIVRQNPKPVTDIQTRKQRSNAGGNIEIGKRDIENPGQPDYSRHQPAGVASHFLGFTQVCCRSY